jgi:hypothetical protein
VVFDRTIRRHFKLRFASHPDYSHLEKAAPIPSRAELAISRPLNFRKRDQ